MAGDWIKMRCDLQTHPKIVRIMSATGADRFRVIGGLHAVWCVFDAHSTDGHLSGYTADLLDQIVGWGGLAAAMLSVGWLVLDAEAIVMPEFCEHNGKGAKRRAEDTKQKRERRKSADDADKDRTREEKRREEKKEQKLSAGAVGFEDFWIAYPQKIGKKPAKAKWEAKRLDSMAAEIVADVRARSASDRKWREGYVPNPATYLTQERWNDEIQTGGKSQPDDWRGVAI